MSSPRSDWSDGVAWVANSVARTPAALSLSTSSSITGSGAQSTSKVRHTASANVDVGTCLLGAGTRQHADTRVAHVHVIDGQRRLAAPAEDLVGRVP